MRNEPKLRVSILHEYFMEVENGKGHRTELCVPKSTEIWPQNILIAALVRNKAVFCYTKVNFTILWGHNVLKDSIFSLQDRIYTKKASILEYQVLFMDDLIW